MERMLALGLMSGTSLDGLDIALCEFRLSPSGWEYEILRAATRAYDEDWQQRLRGVHQADGLTLWKTHVEYGHYLGRQARQFLLESDNHPAVICSHGHTVYHRPDAGFTMQLGAGEAIAAETGIPVVSDFRSGDVALGGQGAPLVPIGDKLLFGKYDACLNIGGFTNVSFDKMGKRIAFDICPANFVLNQLAGKIGLKYDKDGLLASNGRTDHLLLERLGKLPYYSQDPPKSLGREWVEMEFFPEIERAGLSIPDSLRSCCEHIGQQVAIALKEIGTADILVTGGGAHNSFLMEVIRGNSPHEFQIPESLLVDFKEALVFAFLGILRLTHRKNIFASVTGSGRDHSGGAVHDLFPTMEF